MSQPLTLLDKLWTTHEITRRDDGTSLLWVDRHLVHEGSHHAFAKIAARGLQVAEPSLTFGVTDHYAPTRDKSNITDSAIARMIRQLDNNTEEHQIRHFDLHHPQQGIVHVVGPECGLTLPGLLINCGDSHTSTHGAFGALAFGIGATEVAHVLATQTLWQQKPKPMRITINGQLAAGVTAKDIALHWIALLGTSGARGHAVEYTGEAITALSMEARMTLCNLSIEGGARFGLIAPDETTFSYIKDRPFAPDTENWPQAMQHWSTLYSDSGAHFAREIEINAKDISPTITWGTSPDQAIPVDGLIPDDAAHDALTYMGLKSGQKMEGTPIDQVFIGSCTNSRIEDLRAAADVLRGYKAKVPGLVSPGSSQVKRQAEEEGLDVVFKEAGLSWESSGCSLCVGMNGDLVPSGNRCASTTNRNFRGRQGRGSRTHLMSPAMVAAAARFGCIVDPRKLEDIA